METLADLTDEENSLLPIPTRGSASLTSMEAQKRKQKLNQRYLLDPNAQIVASHRLTFWA